MGFSFILFTLNRTLPDVSEVFKEINLVFLGPRCCASDLNKNSLPLISKYDTTDISVLRLKSSFLPDEFPLLLLQLQNVAANVPMDSSSFSLNQSVLVNVHWLVVWNMALMMVNNG